MRRLVVGLAIGIIAGLATPAAFADKQQDQQIASHIYQNLSELKQQGLLRGFDVRMRVSNGTVWLTGHTASDGQRQTVLGIAARTQHLGTVQVVNDIKVKATEVVAQATVQPAPARQGLLATLGVSPNPLRGADMQDCDVANAVAVEETAQSSRRSPAGSGSTFKRRAMYRHPESVQQPAASVAVESSETAAPAPLVTTAPAVQPVIAARPQAIGTGTQPHAAQPYGAVQGNGYVQVPAHVLAQLMAQRQQQLMAQQQQQGGMPMAFAPAQGATHSRLQPIANGQATPMPAHLPGSGTAAMPAQHDNPTMPGYAWPSYASHPNYAAVTYPRQYSPTAWPYIGPYYPYPQVPLAWRKVTLEWKDGWWFLDFKSR